MNNDQIRETNLATIRKFLDCGGPDRARQRQPLFAEQATKEMDMPESGGPSSVRAADWLVQSAEFVPDWAFYENQIFQTDDPNLFMVKSVGRGNAKFSGELAVYINYYINEFLMENGLIKRFRETFNPFERLHR
jgi:phenazine biosynthesis protein